MKGPYYDKKGNPYYLDTHGHRIRKGMVLEAFPRLACQPNDLQVIECYDTLNGIKDLGAQKEDYIISLSEYNISFQIKDYKKSKKSLT